MIDILSVLIAEWLPQDETDSLGGVGLVDFRFAGVRSVGLGDGSESGKGEGGVLEHFKFCFKFLIIIY